MFSFMRKILLTAGTIALFAGCSKDTDIPDYLTCDAGNEGKITLVLKPEHHAEPVIGQPGYPDTAFIKFDAMEYPGDDPLKYDMVIVGEAGADSVVLTNMSCGQYYIYMTGFDTSIVERVRGGIPYFLENEPDDRTISIPVTED